MTSASVSSAKAGRPRDQALDGAILDAARRLFLDNGYASVSMADVARVAAVGKTAIYRRWPSKAELAVAVLKQQADPVADADQDFAAFVRDMGRLFEQIGPILQALIAEAHGDAGVRNALRDSLLGTRRARLEQYFLAARPGMGAAELDTRIAMLAGAFWYRLILGEPINDEFSGQLAISLVEHAGALSVDIASD